MRSLLVALSGLGVAESAANHLSADLTARYAEPQRRYHTIEHIIEVESDAERLLETVGLTGDDEHAVRLAVWFHDAIYDPSAAAGTNEDASADLATASLRTAGLSGPVVAEVARLIRLTTGHDVDPGDRSGAVLVDADLAILAATATRYDRYVHDVRAEYAAVDDDAWRAGRSRVLRRFLAADPLYRIDPERVSRERAARANLGRELASLTAPRSGSTDGPVAGDAALPHGDGGPTPAG